MASSLEMVSRANREMFTLRRMLHEYDENVIIAARAHAKRHDYDNDIAILQNVASTVAGYAKGNFSSY